MDVVVGVVKNFARNYEGGGGVVRGQGSVLVAPFVHGFCFCFVLFFGSLSALS